MRRRSSRGGIFAILLLLVFCLAPGAVGAQEPTQGEGPEPPDLGAQAWALTDEHTGRLLEGKNPDERLPMASTTKIMVALVALEEGTDPDEEVVVSENAASYAGSNYSNVGLYPYDRVSVRELLVAALVPSGTDAVYALAEHLGGEGEAGVDAFVDKMNAKADSMGLKNTHFENPAGLDHPDHYSSARDLAEMTRAAMEYPLFAEAVATEEATITTQDREIEIFNTNELLNAYPEATGVKTGTTTEAGPSLVASAESGDESYVAVLLDAASEEERFGAAETALKYGFDNYDRRPLVSRDEAYGQVGLPYRRDESVKLAAADKVAGLVGPGSEVERRVSAGEAPPEAKAGQKLGEVRVLVDGESVGTSPLVAREGYEEASLWQKTRYAAGGLMQRTGQAAGGLLDRAQGFVEGIVAG